MSKKRYIDTNFWNDTWIEQLTREEKYFFLYLITNEQTSIAGVYEISARRMSFETDFNKVEITQMLKKMESKVRYINGWIVLRNGVKSQNYRNDKIKRGIKAILEQCPIELLEYIDYPKDLDIEVQRAEPEPKQQKLIDDPSMTHDETLHLNVIKYNSIEYKSKAEQPGKPSASASGGSKEPTEKQRKRIYALAAQADRDQEARVAEARTRTGTTAKKGIDLFRERKEQLKRGSIEKS